MDPVEREHIDERPGTQAPAIMITPQTPTPYPTPMATQDIVIWTPARLARAFAAAMLRFPVPVGRKLLPKA